MRDGCVRQKNPGPCGRSSSRTARPAPEAKRRSALAAAPFSPAEEKPAVLEAEEDESHRDADTRGPEKRAGRDRHHTREGDDDHEERKIEEHDWKQVMGPDPLGVERQPAVSPNEAGRIDPGFVAASNPNEYFNEEQTTDSRHP